VTAPSLMKPPASQVTSTPPSLNGYDLKSPGATNKLPDEKTQGQIVGWINDQYTKMKTDRQKTRRQWDINLQMYAGEQYVQELTGKTGIARMGTPQSPRHRERSVTNRTRPLVRTEITRMTSQKPSVTVVPASGEDDDLFAAQSAEAVWEFLYQHANIQWKMERMAFWCVLTGVGIIKTWYDQDKQDKLFKSVMGTPSKGNICFGVVTPYNLFIPDLLCEDIEEQPHVFEAYTRPVEWANMYFKGEFQASSVAKTEIFESAYFQSSGSDNAKPDSVLIKECYIKPGSTNLLKEGALVTIVGDKMVNFQEGMPYSHDEYPYAVTKDLMNGKFYADSILQDTNPLQKEYNKTRNQIIESKNRMARPQLLVPIGTMDPSKYTSEPGKLVMYKPALGKPEPLQLQPIPNYVLEELQRIISDMEDVSGQHQVSRGMAPGQGVVAATAIAYLQEKDESMLATTMSSVEQAITKISRQALSLVVDFWDIPRIIRVAGTDRAFDSFALKGSDIASGLDVRVEPGSSLPMSKSARQAFLMDLFTSGAITAQQMLDMMEMGSVNVLVDRMRIDMRCAQRENLRMKKLTAAGVAEFNQQQMELALQGGEGTTDPNTGIPTIDPANISTYPPMVKVNEWDNHPVHITTHNNYRKSQEFEMLDPEVQDQFAKHIKLHQMYSYAGMMNPMMGQAVQGAQPGMMGMAGDPSQGPPGMDTGAGMPPGGQPGPPGSGGQGGPGMPPGAQPVAPPGVQPQTI